MVIRNIISREELEDNDELELSSIHAIPPEKLQAMKDYAADLIKKHPTWKKRRVMRKTADFFNLVLVVNKDNPNEHTRLNT